MYPEKKQEARKLRIEHGFSYARIATMLQVAKSSVSKWCMDIVLTKEQLGVLDKNQKENSERFARSTAIEASAKNKANAAVARKGYREYGFIRAKTDDVFRIICALYWGEGGKSRNIFSVSNCDTGMLNIVGNWLVKNGYGDKISFCIQCHKSCVSDDMLLKRWMTEMSFIKSSMVRKFSRYGINRASQEKGLDKQPYGTARVSVCSTRLVQQVYGGIEFLRIMGACCNGSDPVLQAGSEGSIPSVPIKSYW